MEFDFGARVRVAAFLHQDRNDPATVAGSELIFSNAEGKPLATGKCRMSTSVRG